MSIPRALYQRHITPRGAILAQVAFNIVIKRTNPIEA